MRALRILLSVSICLLVGFLSGQYTASALDTWYLGLSKPWFNPPDWVFAPVWTILYIMMGIAAGMIWNAMPKQKVAGKALLLFIIQLLLNAIWSVLFFGMRDPLLAFVDIVLLFIAIYFCVREFNAIRKQAAWLLVPYLLWVGFAAVLNLAIVLMN